MAFNLTNALKTLAPTLATMLGGPLAGTAVSALESAFGLSPGGGEKAITDVLQNGTMTPDQMAAVRAADQKHAEIIAQQGIDLQKLNLDHVSAMEKIAADDRDSARKREIVVKDTTPQTLTYMYTWALFTIIAVELFFGYNSIKVDPLIEKTLDQLIGALLVMVIGGKEYYLGTSAGSDKKTDALVNQVKDLNK